MCRQRAELSIVEGNPDSVVTPRCGLRALQLSTMNQQAFAQDRRVGRALLGSWLGSALAAAAVLVPKCPLCAAAYLCLFGLSASSARAVVQLGLPLCIALIAASALATALFVARRGRRLARREKASDSCCGPAR